MNNLPAPRPRQESAPVLLQALTCLVLLWSHQDLARAIIFPMMVIGRATSIWSLSSQYWFDEHFCFRDDLGEMDNIGFQTLDNSGGADPSDINISDEMSKTTVAKSLNSNQGLSSCGC
ncbi:electroneutral sodium bicarbonate exchanger 1 isoform X1 [Lates japonicus]|uniref:Electroneutral sodium bicarbonate exchanger 1 isoform X1 n=1 Tax=Lates japonicus TaxID=270547 RepID=A0AAD3N2L4_LATJO|nr:electroneutral sodium bicarbonate exchanger 1 isoform X1 [Lates japonicus]